MPEKFLIVDGAGAYDQTGRRILKLLQTELSACEGEVETVTLCEGDMGYCAGDFFCWIRTPGMCMSNQNALEFARSAARCDTLVFLTPVGFGGYSALLKRAVDRLTQNNLPFFHEENGKILHQPRYRHNPKMLAIGWVDGTAPGEEAIFCDLVRRNAANLHSPNFFSGVVTAQQADEEITCLLRGWLAETRNGESSPPRELPFYEARGFEKPPCRALLLVGSPRVRGSTSQALGGYLCEQLQAQGIETRTLYLYAAVHSSAESRELLQAVEEHELVVLASPLYLDGLPGAVVSALELIASHDTGKHKRTAFFAIINSGFPEAQQNTLALAMCAAFTRQVGFTWAGGMALGGGAGVVNGVPLVELGWRVRSIRRALELSAAALAAGEAIPEEAVRLMGKRRIPNWLLFIASGIGWRLKARAFKTLRLLRKQPFGID